MKKYILIILAIVLLFPGCEMDEPAVTSTDKNAIFGSAEGLNAYSMSFYDMFLMPPIRR